MHIVCNGRRNCFIFYIKIKNYIVLIERHANMQNEKQLIIHTIEINTMLLNNNWKVYAYYWLKLLVLMREPFESGR